MSYFLDLSVPPHRVELPHLKGNEWAKKRKKNRPVWEVLGDALDDDDDSMQCSVCAL
jgi:hypothetical protein